ncbi:MAG TPA: phosphate ABC transporter permease subunit PstC [Solirubrobacteraceae bacterium]|jgi:phosphate transport system permease protein|nr:phosphate ABC transporter permease subunit PstC [Solirubrobacteraceae bacterium]
MRRGLADRMGDPTLRLLTSVASLAAVVLLVLVVYKVFDQAGESFSHFGLGFIFKTEWNPVTKQFGAGDFLFGTAVTTFAAILIAAPMSIAIALFLTELAPRQTRRPVATLVELLAAIPSVVLGLWGIIVLSPLLVKTIEPALKSALGWIPLFSGTPSPVGLLPAILILTIMAVPIISAVTREVFETVPSDLKEGALALGATRWEMVRMVILPYSRTGIVGATILGMGRALGEAIAVTIVIGHTPRIGASLFESGDTLASRIASEYQGATSTLQISSLAYLGAILLVLALIVNVIARLIVRRAHPKIPTTPGIVR